MNNFWVKSTLAAVACVGLMASSAMAISFSFKGDYTLTNGDTDNFLEILSLGTAEISQKNFEPKNDAIFYDNGNLDKVETVVFKPFSIVDTSVVNFGNGVYTYTFNSPVIDGFTVYDDDQITVLFIADIKLETLKIDNGTASINNMLTMNLFNIRAGEDYTPGSSAIIDSFLVNYPGSGGGTNISLQLGPSFFNAINNINNLKEIGSTYSGYATPVPEPGVTMLFGLGVVGFAGVIRRRRTLTA